MDKQFNITMSRKEQREWRKFEHKTIAREQYKRQKYVHDLFCDCRRCDSSIVTKWRKISVKDMA